MDDSLEANAVKRDLGKPNDGIFKYLIAACIIGTAIGNMFVARKMKSFQHMSSPFSNSKTAPSNGDYVRQRLAEEQRRRERIRNFEHQREQTERIRQQFDRRFRGVTSCDSYPDYVRSALRVMEVSDPPKLLSKEYVKQLYQSMAMKYHPDRIPVNDKRKGEYDKKFKDIVEANQVLVQYLSQVNKRI